MAISRCTDGIPSEIKLKPYEGDLDMLHKFCWDSPMLLTFQIFFLKKSTHLEIFGLMFSRCFFCSSIPVGILTS